MHEIDVRMRRETLGAVQVLKSWFSLTAHWSDAGTHVIMIIWTLFRRKRSVRHDCQTPDNFPRMSSGNAQLLQVCASSLTHNPSHVAMAMQEIMCRISNHILFWTSDWRNRTWPTLWDVFCACCVESRHERVIFTPHSCHWGMLSHAFIAEMRLLLFIPNHSLVLVLNH